MDLQLANQVAVIVGGAQGIGRAIAAQFAAEGCRVAIVDYSERVTAAAADLAAVHNSEVLGYRADVTRLEQLTQARDLLLRDFSGCDHVVYAAGLGSGKFGFPFWNLDSADWPRIIDVNLVGAVSTAQVFQEALRSSPTGSMAFLSSIAGQIGSQTDPPYSAAKAGLINFSQCAAKDLAPYGVRVNTVCPGMVQTELNRSVYQAWADRQPADQQMTYETWAGEKIRKLVPLGRWQSPEDIANMVVFLASPRCRNVTGQTINVDGGFVMHW